MFATIFKNRKKQKGENVKRLSERNAVPAANDEETIVVVANAAR